MQTNVSCAAISNRWFDVLDLFYARAQLRAQITICEQAGLMRTRRMQRLQHTGFQLNDVPTWSSDESLPASMPLHLPFWDLAAWHGFTRTTCAKTKDKQQEFHVSAW
jgi:hypothetical protein